MKLAFIVLALAASSAFANDSPLFEVEVLAEGARVTTDVDLPSTVWDKRCRQALTLPYGKQLRDQLGDRVGYPIPEAVNFVDAQIEDYQSFRDGDWLVCAGSVALSDIDKNLAGLAVRAAWHPEAEANPQMLRALLLVAMAHPYAAADAVARVASLAPPEQQLSYLDTHLAPQDLQMDTAKHAVMQLWLAQGRWEDVIQLGDSCSTVACRTVSAEAEKEKDKEDANKVDDLSSYL